MVDAADAGGSSVDSSSFSLTRKLGPLPVWGWCAIAIIGVLAYKHFRPSTPADTTTTPAIDGTTTVPVTDGPATTTAPSNADVPVYSNGPSNVTQAPETNAEWKSQALSQVGSLNTWGAYAITNALSAYLGGSTLDSTQQPIVDQALKMVGPPPEHINTPTSIVPQPTGSTITLTQTNNAPTTMHAGRTRLTWGVRWIDKDSKAITGMLQQQWQNGGQNSYINGTQIHVINGVGSFSGTPGVIGTSHIRFITTPSDYSHAPAVSNILTYKIIP